ncbi:MAG TPA: cobyric acid synthase [bacterium]|nr:cobyric acid synthase [bacterium]HPO81685.1 cobyric acid synthase [bacterium]
MSRAKSIMIQGTASSVGKSMLVTALCRIFTLDGFRVAPFKSQNMALNSFVTVDGGEIGRAQAVQAEACGIEPSVLMNPVLLKPSSDVGSQVIIKGKVFKNMTAEEYQRFKPELREIIKDAYEELAANHDIVVIEGAGSPAEINLKDNDIVNMGMAEIADCPVLIVGDIDKGGVFASIVGTMILLDQRERKRVSGIIINKFRGDVEILRPGLSMLEKIIKRPVLGVIPYMRIHIDEEDSATEHLRLTKEDGDLDVAIVYLPHISNFTDFEPLYSVNELKIRYVYSADTFGSPDLVIIPGTKNTIGDLLYLKYNKISEEIIRYAREGRLVIGICGGFQMLGKEILDPYGIESDIKETEGLGLLDISTTIEGEKITAQTIIQLEPAISSIFPGLSGSTLKGYEIHMGRTEDLGNSIPFSRIIKRGEFLCNEIDGYMSCDGNVFGTYLHGIFDNESFLKGLVSLIYRRKGIEKDVDINPVTEEFKYNELARIVRESVDIQEIYRIMGL